VSLSSRSLLTTIAGLLILASVPGFGVVAASAWRRGGPRRLWALTVLWIAGLAWLGTAGEAPEMVAAVGGLPLVAGAMRAHALGRRGASPHEQRDATVLVCLLTWPLAFIIGLYWALERCSGGCL
jgi:hypothetical protein